MQKELEMWKEENKEHQIALKREQRFAYNNRNITCKTSVFWSHVGCKTNRNF